MRDEELLRYSRQIALPEVDIEGQKRINESRAFIIGLGGLGTVVSSYLCRMGVGNIILCDYDKIDISNLHRQILFNSEDIGFQKTKVTKKKLNLINPDVAVEIIQDKLDKKKLNLYLNKQTIVVDATDNFRTRYAINEICFKYKKPLISGSAIGWKGQLLVLDFRKKDSPCYQCLYGSNMVDEESCSELGILPPIAGFIGSLQAMEVIKLILKKDNSSYSLMEFDGKSNEIRKFNVNRDPRCKVCG